MHRLTETVRQEHDLMMNMHHDSASFEDPLNDDEELFDDLDESWATDAAAEDRAPEDEDEDPIGEARR